MTQDYEPIELTDDTPEPKDEGIYFIHSYSPCVVSEMVAIYRISKGWELPGVADEPITWPELIKCRNMHEKITIQSLAAHDAQIRAEGHVKALELTDYEIEIMADAYSNSDEFNHGDDVGAMSVAVQAIIKHRREQKQ